MYLHTLHAHVVFRKLLKQPVPYQFQTSAIVAENSVDDTPHLWLCYWYENTKLITVVLTLLFVVCI